MIESFKMNYFLELITMISLEYLSADMLPIFISLFFRISRYRVEKKE